MKFLLILMLTVFGVLSCTSDKKNPELVALTKQFQEALEKQKNLEEEIKKLGESDPGRTQFLTQDLELLKSRILGMRERGKTLNEGKDLFPDPAASAGSQH